MKTEIMMEFEDGTTCSFEEAARECEGNGSSVVVAICDGEFGLPLYIRRIRRVENESGNFEFHVFDEVYDDVSDEWKILKTPRAIFAEVSDALSFCQDTVSRM